MASAAGSAALLNRSAVGADTDPVSALAKRWVPFALMAGIAAWIASTADSMGDWQIDAGPAVEALAAGHVGQYLNADALMGPFATVIQAPFVAISGTMGLDAYRWAAFPCLLAAGLLGLYLAAIARRRGAGLPSQALIAILCLVNPLTFEALEYGHPEEILTAALAVAAVAAAAERHTWRAAILLGLAIASKQWAVIAVLPALMALPGRRFQVAAAAAGIAIVLFLPASIASPGSLLGVQEQAAATGHVVTPWSAWYPAASTRTAVYSVGGERLVGQVEDAPGLADRFSHPLIILIALAVPLALWLRRRPLPLPASDAMALLALIALLRCVLDPVDNLYYHAPLLLAVIGWDAFACRGLPLRSLIAVGTAVLFWHAWHDLSDPMAFNAVYLGFIGVAGLIFASSLFRPFPGRAFQSHHFSPDEAPISGIK